jgi:hypothetical protein
MSHFARGLFASVVAATVIGGVAFVSTQAGAATLSKADKAALKEATASCKHEAKGKKIHWPASRAYVRDCVKEALKDHPNINVIKLYIDDPDMPVTQVKDHM